MFLDEELECIAVQPLEHMDKLNALMQACYDRMPKNPSEIRTMRDFANYVKRIDASWRLFTKKHPEYRADGFKEYFVQNSFLSKPYESDKGFYDELFKELRWEIIPKEYYNGCRYETL